MVVGIVIGSGVFFKAQDVLDETHGNSTLGVLAWIIGGGVMIALATTFSIMATKYAKVNGIVDYAEATCGKTYAYYIGWFLSAVYYPAMTSVLAWVSARYTVVLIYGVTAISDKALFGPECITIAAFYLILMYFINSIAPKFAGSLQVSMTVAKLIPIVFIALVGTVIGLVNGTMVENFTAVPGTPAEDAGIGEMFAAVCCTAFAYEGWIIATSINAEIKDAKKNLPIALMVGTGIIMAAYVLYYIGVLGLSKTDVLMAEGTTVAFKYFGTAASAIISFLIIVSCLGTLNGLMLGCTRGVYSLAARGEGLSPDTFRQIDDKTNMPHNSAMLALLLCGFWFLYFIGGQFFGWFGKFAFDSSELPIITVYPMYIPIIITFMKKEKDLPPARRFLIPSLGILGCLVMVAASIFRHGEDIPYYLIVFAAFMAVGALAEYFNRRREKSIS